MLANDATDSEFLRRPRLAFSAAALSCELLLFSINSAIFLFIWLLASSMITVREACLGKLISTDYTLEVFLHSLS